MSVELPFQLKYELSRRQRLFPHLMFWVRKFYGVMIFLFGLVVSVVIFWWFFSILILVFWITRDIWIEIADVVFHRVKRMDIIVEENRFGILVGVKRKWLFLYGIISMDQYIPGIWTIHHCSGRWVQIPESVITAEQVHYIKDVAAQGSPEGIQTDFDPFDD
jgi:hypothetical protein